MNKDFLYQAYYCEENVWQLCVHPHFKLAEKRVVFISNPRRTCAVWHMKTVSDPTLPVIWDYHCIFLARDKDWQVWDHDSSLGWPVAASGYFSLSFKPDIKPAFQAYFRIVDGDRFQREFSSDRQHMREMDGRWKHPPPAWATIGKGRGEANLSNYLDLGRTDLGQVTDLAGIIALFA